MLVTSLYKASQSFRNIDSHCGSYNDAFHWQFCKRLFYENSKLLWNENCKNFQLYTHSFLISLLKARDDDEPGTVNSQVKYRILQASDGLQNKFQVDPDSGVITLSDKIDYEALDPALTGKVLLEIEAYDLGTPTLRSKINVTVEVEVWSLAKFETWNGICWHGKNKIINIPLGFSKFIPVKVPS